MSAIANRFDFVLLFDVINGNPNGDPDAGNLPRIDAETGHGLVTDVALKRKVRNFVGLTKGEQPPFDIYIKEKAVLNRTHERAYIEVGAEEELKAEGKKRKGSADTVERARHWICSNFYDVRTFGAVMSTGGNCGQVRGPVQLTFARSVDPVITQEHAITRMAVATEAEAEKQQGDNRTMGRKFTVPYGLYRAHGFVSAHLAEQTGFNDDDLQLLWDALSNMFEHDHSASRGEMACRGLYVFKHDSKLGNAPAHVLFETVEIAPGNNQPPRSFADYGSRIAINESAMPGGVELLRIIG
ncbi:MAG: type I-C CRISPR-associated protein Cas7/Csd2 [Candidatus Thiodiazotropha sp.]